MKREMLRREGVDVEALESLGRKGVRYIGSKTTKIVCFPTCRDAKRIREENRVPFRARTKRKRKDSGHVDDASRSRSRRKSVH